VAIVTGGATGLGRAIAIEFGKLGCNVAFCFVNMPGRDVTEQALLTETALTAMGVGVHACRCDVRDRDAVERFVLDVKAKLGGSTSSSTTPASRATGRSGGSASRPGPTCSTPRLAPSTASGRWRRCSARSTTARS
jgi:NAD(P)-dependent dehydrogenase (short-subunit alcohol dehydrogenase family)